MIKNRNELLHGIPPPYKERRDILLTLAARVIDELSPQKLLHGCFPKTPLNKFKKIAVIGIGKAASSMVKATLAHIKRKPDIVLLANEGHPLPSPAGLKRTQKIITSARSLGKDDLAIVLISGGGSAMLTAPAENITIQDKRTLTKQLLASGATIQEMNVVRKHISLVKGGNLAALLYPATVWGFIISDVVGNDLSTIASGPLSADTSTFRDAVKILKKYGLKPPSRIAKYLARGIKDSSLETPKPGARYFNKVSIRILADHKTVLDHAAKLAKTLKLPAKIISRSITREAREAVKTFLTRTRKNGLTIASGETTVTCCGRRFLGCGGRNQEFILGAVDRLTDRQTILSVGTDGVDGICPEEVAGAIADAATQVLAKRKKLTAAAYLKRNDSYAFFKATQGLIKTGATGTNLGDLMLLLEVPLPRGLPLQKPRHR